MNQQQIQQQAAEAWAKWEAELWAAVAEAAARPEWKAWADKIQQGRTGGAA